MLGFTFKFLKLFFLNFVELEPSSIKNKYGGQNEKFQLNKNCFLIKIKL